MSMSGHKGYFIPKSRFETLESQVHELMVEDSASPKGLLELQGQLDEAFKANDIANAALKAKEEEVADWSQRFAKAGADAESRFHVMDQALSALHDERKTLLADLTSAKSENSSARQAAQKASKGFSPEEAIAAKEAHRAAAQNVTDLNSKLSEVNSQVAKLKADVDKANKTKAAVATSFRDACQQLEKLKAEKAVAELENPPPALAKVEIKSKLVKGILGDKGLAWLKRAAEANENEVRERLYQMVNAVRSNQRDPKIRGLADLIQIVLDWVKRQSHVARLRIKPWLDFVQNDLANGVVRKLSEYRKMLEDLVADFKVQARAKSEQYKKKFDFSQFGTWYWRAYIETRSWTIVLSKRAKYTTVGVARGVAQAARNLRDIVSHAWSSGMSGDSYEVASAKGKSVAELSWPKIKRAFWSAWPGKGKQVVDSDVVYEVVENAPLTSSL